MYRAFALAVLLAATTLACERPFVAEEPPAVEVVEPDLELVQTQRRMPLALRASSFRDVARVELGGVPMVYDEQDRVWRDTLRLVRGLNVLRVEAFDSEAVSRVDTLYALFMPLTVRRGADLSFGLGGHAAVRLRNGAVLAAGGTPNWGGFPVATAFIYDPGTDRMVFVEPGLLEARHGHTLTRLPDGSALVVGGIRRAQLNLPADLVETVERFDPMSQRFVPMRVVGDPIRRAFHTASLRQTEAGMILDLVGGEGDVRYSPPVLGLKRGIRRFLVRGDSLTALNSRPTDLFLDHPVAGHTQTAIGPNRYLVAGTYAAGNAIEAVSFVLDFDDPFTFERELAATMRVGRTRHAAAAPSDEAVLLMGGYLGDPTRLARQAEIYAPGAERYFLMPPSFGLEERFGHTATLLADGRILVLGGFSARGNGLERAAYVAIQPD